MKPFTSQQGCTGCSQATRVFDTDASIAITSAMPGSVEMYYSLALGVPYARLYDSYARYFWDAYWYSVQLSDGLTESLDVL